MDTSGRQSTIGKPDHTNILIGSVQTTDLGLIWAAISDGGLVAVEFGVGRARFAITLRRRMACQIQDAPQPTRSITRQLGEYAAGKRRNFEVEIDWSVVRSESQRATLRAVTEIPYGQTRTYAQIAAQIGNPRAARAVGQANAANPIPLIIPCHRVVGADGRLCGYGGQGGIKTKRWLLEMESSCLLRSW